MSYVFIPGNSYWVLTQDQYDEMVLMLEDLELDYDLAGDFTKADDDNWYAIVGADSINDGELAFMEYWGFSNILEYKRSVQSTNFFG